MAQAAGRVDAPHQPVPVSRVSTVDKDRPSGRHGRTWRRHLIGLPVWVAVCGVSVWALVRTFGWERGTGRELVAFTPYVAAGAAALTIVTLLLRRWWAGAVAFLMTASLAAAILPRMTADADRGPAAGVGPVVRVMTINMLAGGADAGRITDLVRRHHVDVLAVQEFTERSEWRLTAGGLEAVLPYHVVAPEPWVAGSALYSRFPLDEGQAYRHRRSGFRQVSATLAVPGAAPVEVESVHPCAPSPGDNRIDCWVGDFADPQPSTQQGPARVLAGDFNATLDHAMMRQLIGTGYRDAADTVGVGLVPSWPYDGRWVPWVTLDHVLVDRRVGVRAVSVYRVPRSDHRAVIAELVLPRA